MAETLNQATGKLLENNKSPGRKVNELDNRGSHFYLALYWAQALASQTKSQQLQDHFRDLANQLSENESIIVDELNSAQGAAVDIGGYYEPDTDKTDRAMRPSPTFNGALEPLLR